MRTINHLLPLGRLGGGLLLLLLLFSCQSPKPKHPASTIPEYEDPYAKEMREIEVTEAMMKTRIGDFYRTFVIGDAPLDDAAINEYCSVRLSQKMNHKIDLFRDYGQEPISDESCIVETITTGVRKFEIMYIDKGRRIKAEVTVVIEDKKVKLDIISIMSE